MQIPTAWQELLGEEVQKTYFRDLVVFLKSERAAKTIFPPEQGVFNALALTAPDDVKVVLLGQDPYHGPGQAHGLCFSVKAPTKPPPSLKNIFRELHDDLDLDVQADNGDLTAWSRQGVLMLNTVLTVVAHEPASHQKRGWETFTDAVIVTLCEFTRPLVFCLWGNHAKSKAKLIDVSRHAVVEGAHPSPLSAKRFFGSRPFSRINAALATAGRPPIDWSLTTSP